MLQQFVKAYNKPVYTALGMPPPAVTPKQVLEIWTLINERSTCVRVGTVKFNVGQHVRISKEKMKSAKGRKRIILTRYLES